MGNWLPRRKQGEMGVRKVRPITQAISHAAGSSTDIFALSPTVDPTRTLIFSKSIIGSAASEPFGNAGCYLKSASEIEFTSLVVGAGTWSATFAVDVVELRDAPVSIQWVQGGALTRTINAVDTNKTTVLSMNFGAQTNQTIATATLTDATTVTITNGTASGASVMWWCVIEWR